MNEWTSSLPLSGTAAPLCYQQSVRGMWHSTLRTVIACMQTVTSRSQSSQYHSGWALASPDARVIYRRMGLSAPLILQPRSFFLCLLSVCAHTSTTACSLLAHTIDQATAGCCQQTVREDSEPPHDCTFICAVGCNLQNRDETVYSRKP